MWWKLIRAIRSLDEKSLSSYNQTAVMKELTLVKEALVTSYNMIEILESRIQRLESEAKTLPWQKSKTEEIPSSSYNDTPAPTPAIENLATGMVRQMVARNFNDTKADCRRIYAEHDRVVIWKNGVVTTLGENISTKNPLAVFKSRACARVNLRLAGYIVPSATTYEGSSTKKYIIAVKN
jgi:hypothetical protein